MQTCGMIVLSDTSVKSRRRPFRSAPVLYAFADSKRILSIWLMALYQSAGKTAYAFQLAMDSSTFASFSFAFASFSRSFWISCAGAFSQKPGLFSFF